MSDDRGLLQAVCEFPADDLPRLAYADWCEEQGDNDRAEFTRVQVELAGLVDAGLAHARRSADGPVALRGKSDGRGRERLALYRRERELWERHKCEWFGDRWAILCLGGDPDDPADIYPDLTTALVSRGFVSEIRLPLAAFLGYAAAIFRAHPVEWVVLTDRKPYLGSHWYDGERRAANGAVAYHSESDLPTTLFDLLKGYEESNVYEFAKYYKPGKAPEALSNACVTYGRSLTWDKAPGKRIKDMKGKVGRVT